MNATFVVNAGETITLSVDADAKMLLNGEPWTPAPSDPRAMLAAALADEEGVMALAEAMRVTFPVPESFEAWQSMADRTYESDAALLAAELRKPR